MSDSESSCGRSDRDILDSDSEAAQDELVLDVAIQNTSPLGEGRGIKPHADKDYSDHDKNQAFKSPFMDILGIITEFGPTTVDLTRLGNLVTLDENVTRVACALGSGATAKVIRHVTDDGTEDIVKSGTSIALKIFTPTDWLSAKSRTEIMDSIRREIQVLCNPAVARHPNIVKLLFLGFQVEDPFPTIAMEVGNYGSLDYVLRQSGMGPSQLQRFHITMDIACGIKQLHKSGIIHGDLKPDNIILFDHPRRVTGVIAKITDFGGSRSTILSGAFMPHITELWCAPEVLSRDEDIDWQKSDVYSYGLVIASLFARPVEFQFEGKKSCCFLSSFIPRNITGEDLTHMLWTLKATDENHSGVAYCARQSAPPEYVEKLELILPTLNRYFWLRPSISQIVDSLASIPSLKELVQANTRNSEDAETIQTQLRPRRHNLDGSRLRFAVWSADLYGRSDSFRSYVLQQLREEFGASKRYHSLDPILDIPAEIGDIHPGAFLNMLVGAIRKMPAFTKYQGSFGTMMAKGRHAFDVAACHLLGFGTEKDVQEGHKWLRESALLGWPMALFLYPLMQDEERGFPIRLFLCVGALCGSPLALQKLAKHWPSLFRALRNIFKCSDRGYSRPSIESLGPFLLGHRGPMAGWLDTHFEGEPSESHDEESRIEEILKLGSINDALHELGVLIDEEAASLARLLVEKGARLDCLCPAQAVFQFGARGTVTSAIHIHQPLLLSPLSGAIRRGQEKLACAILDIHIEQEIAIPDAVGAICMSVSWWHAEIAQRLLRLASTSSHLCQSIEGQPPLSSINPTMLLKEAINNPAISESKDFEMRAVHGSGYNMAQAKMLELLILKGASIFQMDEPQDSVQDFAEIDSAMPRGIARGLSISRQVVQKMTDELADLPHLANLAAAFRRGHSAFYESLKIDDLTALTVFVQHTQARSLDITHWLENPLLGVPASTMGLEAEPNALQVCIENKSSGCFHFLLDNFPHLIHHRDGNGHTPLITACFQRDDNTFVEALLEQGADFMVSLIPGHSQLSSPLAISLARRSVVAAELISSRCSETQLRNLLARSDETGRSVFSQLFDQWGTRQGPGLLDSFRWVMRMGGAHFFADARLIPNEGLVEIPTWSKLLAKKPSAVRADVLQDLELLQLLFDFFPHQVEQPDAASGWAPLHHAVAQGHVEIVRELVVNRRVDVNMETIPSLYSSRRMPGAEKLTPLDIWASVQSSSVPTEIQRRGTLDMIRWKEGLSSIGQILLSSGAKTGPKHKGPSLDPTRRAMDLLSNGPSDQSPSSLQLRRHQDYWPQELPKDDSAQDPYFFNMVRLQSELLRTAGTMTSIMPPRSLTEELSRPTWSQTQIEHNRDRAELMKSHWRRLPPGWDVRRDENGRIYYVDLETESRTWEKPLVPDSEYFRTWE